MNTCRNTKILGIACSPRIQGNTALLLKEALAGAQNAGAETELLYLRRYEFSPCVACNGCFNTGQCVLRDDMQPIYEKLLDADRIILAAPIFSMGINALAKMMIDRCQSFWATQNILKLPVIADPSCRPPRKGIYISTAGSNISQVFTEAERVVRYFFRTLEAEYIGSYCYNKVDAAGDILNHPKALEEVFEAGRNLAK